MTNRPSNKSQYAGAKVTATTPMKNAAPRPARSGRRPWRSEMRPLPSAPMTAPSSRTLTAKPCWKALRSKSSRMNSSAPEMIPVSKPNRKLPMVMAIAHLRTVLSPFGVSSTKWLSAEAWCPTVRSCLPALPVLRAGSSGSVLVERDTAGTPCLHHGFDDAPRLDRHVAAHRQWLFVQQDTPEHFAVLEQVACTETRVKGHL